MSKEPMQKTDQRTGQQYSPAASTHEGAVGTSKLDRERGISTRREPISGMPSPITPFFGSYPFLGATQPFSLMQRMRDDVDRLFGQFAFGGTERTLWSPQVELFQRGNDFVVRADLPGVKKEDLNIELEDDVLTLSGERRSENEEKGEGFYRSERSYGSFYRSIPLPNEVKADQVNATFRDGVLEVTLPAPQQATSKAKKIDIR